MFGKSNKTGPPGVAVVTGGTAGIGRAVVRELAARGWDVAVLARGQARLDDTVAEVHAAGRRALGISVDVSDHVAVDAAADRVADELGGIDLWVNDAFTGAIAFFDELTPEEYERITAVTYFGFVNGTRAALRHMKQRDRGTIIQVGSALASRGIALQSAYCGAKAAIEDFTESLLVELKHKGSGIQICQVHMPGVNTPQFDWVLHRGIDHHPMPVPPIYQPEVCARAVAHVAEHPRRTMWVGLPTALTILGNRAAPSLLEWYLAKTNVKGQQSPDHDPPGREHNAWEPVYGSEVQARGSFDAQAHTHSPSCGSVSTAVWSPQARSPPSRRPSPAPGGSGSERRGQTSTPAGRSLTLQRYAATSEPLEEVVEDPDNRLAIRALAVVAVFAAVAWPIREVFGAAGVNAALVVALGAIPIVLLRERPRPAGHSQAQGAIDDGRTPDTWRSERWIRNTVEEGIEGLEDWRRRQDRG